jgi:hypothetical protein
MCAGVLRGARATLAACCCCAAARGLHGLQLAVQA